ncbi:rhodanese-like domain-containing protein [Mycolicibacterium novocastrense]|uniref:Rhodanese domain-containing protein n=1 Tax=Mycolicibacterium novocastrense TaxID=59813 RepID=A0AAW5SLB6_MYCNV|nr:rhodanese-like domain-containing protein [Mycolicibacterium novocastrense]MCV7024320.1 rhodanese-like domain-containing protein [Mycolicibacterium novocastrense]GAT06891.1 rhodanese domain-containing protein [Mycolicibacterium novocastrense]
MNTSTPAAIDAQELRALMNSTAPPRVLDVRTPGEFETAHMPGAYNVPLDMLRGHRDEIAKRLDQQVVLVCRSGQRATAADQALRGADVTNVHILDGGMTAWEALGFPVERAAQRWDLERQVRLVAGCLVLSSVVSSIVAPRLKWLAAGIGGGLAAAALTDTCAMGTMLSKLSYNRGATCDARTIVAQLTDNVAAHPKAR